MKIKFRIAASILSAVLAFSLTACGGNSEPAPENDGTESAEITTAQQIKKPVPTFTVVIDPGHGFGDPGSHPKYLYSDEADITLKAALLLKDKLSAAGIKSVLIHNGQDYPTVNEICAAAEKYRVEYDKEKMNDNDVFSAYERVIYANTLQAALGNCFYVSLHTNSVENSPSTGGLSIDYYADSPFCTALDSFCQSFRDSVRSALDKDTVIFADNAEESYIVNKYCLSPSVLIEMGYGSNSRDGSDLMNDAWLDKFAEMLTECIAENKGLFLE